MLLDAEPEKERKKIENKENIMRWNKREIENMDSVVFFFFLFFVDLAQRQIARVISTFTCLFSFIFVIYTDYSHVPWN